MLFCRRGRRRESFFLKAHLASAQGRIGVLFLADGSCDLLQVSATEEGEEDEDQTFSLLEKEGGK